MVVSPRAREARAIPRARSELAHLAGLRGLGFGGFGFALDLLTYCFVACSRVFEGVRECFEGVRAF